METRISRLILSAACAACFVLLAGCMGVAPAGGAAGGRHYICKPDPGGGVAKTGLTAYVVSFEDGTPSYRIRGKSYNMAKGGWSPKIDPATLAKCLADHLAASGLFSKAEFALAGGGGADVEIRGTLYDGSVTDIGTSFSDYNIRMELEAVRSSNSETLWRRELSGYRRLSYREGLRKSSRGVDEILSEIYGQVRADLAGALAGVTPSAVGGSAAQPGKYEDMSVEDILNRIGDSE